MSMTGRTWMVAALATTWGCQVDWGGAQISLENPAPPPDTTATAVEQLEPEQLPLPSGPHLYAVRLDTNGAARVVPLTTIAFGDENEVDRLEDISIPESEDPSFPGRFDSAFVASGTELDLLARGGRIGSVIVGATIGSRTAGCPSVASGRALLVPGQDVPPLALAVPAGLGGEDGAARIPPVESTSSMGVAGPVLAERLIGGDRAFLARLQSITPIAIPGDTLAGMAATWLVADSLAVGPPGDQAASLFFMSRFEPTRGFIPFWEEVRRYNSPEDKEAFEFVDWVMLGERRVDMLRRYDSETVRLAFSVSSEGEDQEVSWVDPAECGTLQRLGR